LAAKVPGRTASSTKKYTILFEATGQDQEAITENPREEHVPIDASRENVQSLDPIASMPSECR
jgi:hypothetical protein